MSQFGPSFDESNTLRDGARSSRYLEISYAPKYLARERCMNRDKTEVGNFHPFPSPRTRGSIEGSTSGNPRHMCVWETRGPRRVAIIDPRGVAGLSKYRPSPNPRGVNLIDQTRNGVQAPKSVLAGARVRHFCASRSQRLWVTVVGVSPLPSIAEKASSTKVILPAA